MSENTNGAEEAPEKTAAEETAAPETLTPEVNETEQNAAIEPESSIPAIAPISKAEAFIKKVEGSPYAIAHEAKAIIEELVALIKA